MEQKKSIFFPYRHSSSLFMLLTISLVLLLVHFVTLNGGHLVPNTWQSFVEILYDFVLNLVSSNLCYFYFYYYFVI
jgi:F0F1-type ATP synthase membrane subunit a